MSMHMNQVGSSPVTACVTESNRQISSYENGSGLVHHSEHGCHQYYNPTQGIQDGTSTCNTCRCPVKRVPVDTGYRGTMFRTLDMNAPASLQLPMSYENKRKLMKDSCVSC